MKTHGNRIIGRLKKRKKVNLEVPLWSVRAKIALNGDTHGASVAGAGTNEASFSPNSISLPVSIFHTTFFHPLSTLSTYRWMKPLKACNIYQQSADKLVHLKASDTQCVLLI